MSRGWPRLALALTGALLVAGCEGMADTAQEPVRRTDGAKPAYGDTFIDVLTGNVSGLIPNIVSDSASFDVGNLIYSGLVTRDKDLNFIGDLAESWTFSEDCRELTFKLRPNVRWHDGHPFTSSDVAFTYETMVNPKTPTAYRESFKMVEAVETPDAHTVSVRYKKPFAKALDTWGLWMLPRHLLESYMREGKLREAPQNWSAPVGTGPYRFSQLKSGEKIVLLANPDYWEGRPYLSRVVYRIIPSQATIFLELKARGLDAAGLTALQYKRQTDYPAFRNAYHKFRYPSNGYSYFGLNLRDPRFADKRVRQAFAHAINKSELIDGVSLGLGREATGPYKPGTWVYNPDVTRYPYDLAKAKALLAEVGWKDTDGDGVLDKDGKPFKFELLTNQGNDERKKIAGIIQASLREVGVAVEVRVLEWAAFLKEYVKKRRFEAIVLGWGIGLDPDQYDVWHSSKTGPDELNHISYQNAEVDDLLEKGRTTCVQSERKKYYDRLQEVLADEQPIVFLYFRDTLPVVSSRVLGIIETPNGIRYKFHEWFVPKQAQRYTAG